MATVPYAHVTRGPAIVQPIGPAVVTRPRVPNPLLPLCCIGLILFLIAATIILALIPVYLRTRRIEAQTNTVSYTVLYRLNNGTLPVGALPGYDCIAIQQDQRNLAASDNGVSPSVPTVVRCTVIGNTSTTSGRRRRQSQVVGNLIRIDGFLSGAGNCRRGTCLRRRGERFIALLLARGTFFLTLIDGNGNAFLFSITVISASVTSTQGSSSSSSAALVNDIAILNFALTTENLEATFYGQFQANFTAQDFVNANYSAEAYNYFNLIYSHEQAHVRILTSVISQLGGTPVPACTYDFSSVVDVKSYVALARTFENTGTRAYDGAANGIADPRLREMAATIATVEARHASYLNLIQGANPFPDRFENATPPATVVEIIRPYLKSCPYTIVVPTVPYIGSSSYSGSVPTSNNPSVSPYTSTMYTNDLRALNYALISEHLESTFYNTYVSNFTSNDFTSNGFQDATIYFIMIREIENAHVTFLETTIRQRGGTPVSNCTYNFNVTNVKDFVNLSRTFENTGQKAYDGAIDTISDPNVITYAASIATVEARFASYLNKLTGNIPFPDQTDPKLDPPEVVSVLSAYQTCPFTPDLPVVLNPSTLAYSV